MTRAFLLGLALFVTSAGLSADQAQTGAPAGSNPTFEVASVKLSDPNQTGPLASIPIVRPLAGGRFTASNVTLRVLVRLAYGVQDFQIDGGPSWQTSQRFDINAKAEDATASSMVQLPPMLKALLADRFKLKVRTESRETPVHALVIARSDGKLGPKLTPSTADCSNAAAEQQKLAEALARGGPAAAAALLPKPGETRTCAVTPLMGADGFGIRANGQSLIILTQLLTQVTGRIVHDTTGLTGLYDWEMKFDPQALLQVAAQSGINLPPGVTLPASDSPSLLTALREDLGLKLESERGPVDFIVIESAELPTPD
jgi:uncharacterized protein (TIGR03435 family)